MGRRNSVSYNLLEGIAPQNGLEAEYLFPNNADDTSGNGRNLTSTDFTPTKDDWFRPNEARLYDGVNDKDIYVEDWDSVLGTEWSVSFWVKFGNTTDSPAFIAAFRSNTLATTNNQIDLFQLGSTLRFRVRDNAINNVQIDYSNIVAGKYYHIAFIRDGNDLKLYVDNLLIGNIDASSIGTQVLDILTLGCVYNDTSDVYESFLDGTLDLIRIYSIALNDVQINNLYYETVEYKGKILTILDRGLVANYQCNGNVRDNGLNGYHGVLSGATLDDDQYGNADKSYLFDADFENISISSLVEPLGASIIFFLV